MSFKHFYPVSFRGFGQEPSGGTPLSQRSGICMTFSACILFSFQRYLFSSERMVLGSGKRLCTKYPLQMEGAGYWVNKKVGMGSLLDQKTILSLKVVKQHQKDRGLGSTKQNSFKTVSIYQNNFNVPNVLNISEDVEVSIFFSISQIF